MGAVATFDQIPPLFNIWNSDISTRVQNFDEVRIRVLELIGLIMVGPVGESGRKRFHHFHRSPVDVLDGHVDRELGHFRRIQSHQFQHRPSVGAVLAALQAGGTRT